MKPLFGKFISNDLKRAINYLTLYSLMLIDLQQKESIKVAVKTLCLQEKYKCDTSH